MSNNGEILAALLKKYSDCFFFLHNTREQVVAEKILKEGFIFENQLVHSTDRVNPDESIEITYFLFLRKDYGPYTIIIAIPSVTYESYMAYSVLNVISIEEVISITKPCYGENDELLYTISPKHVLGYFNLTSGTFVQNLGWDMAFSNCKRGSHGAG